MRHYSVFQNAPVLFDGAIGNYSFVKFVQEGLGSTSSKDQMILEGYFNDLYKLFLRRLAEFDCASQFEEKDAKNLRSILEELVKVKGMLGGQKSE